MSRVKCRETQLSRVSSYSSRPFLTRGGADTCCSRGHVMAPVYDLQVAREAKVAERSYSTSEMAEVADGLRRLLNAIEVGEVTASSGTVSRLEGAIAALETLANGSEASGVVPR
jgi:hypothetical protein